ncbi:uncharacterized protein LOC116687121 [Etheostoma spectabile]|uniref:uncharacterized protein LOC116687121 n=1 Tax=Etheostoma spectabile TaxID=54343 RepID=UPI0013AFD9B7|nr:uncharacterized protein LOC116687121 [Etheostoma spectabile]XP_032368166.1 uncharacterized protein LOC116687121 [Etheostoma spectabile]
MHQHTHQQAFLPILHQSMTIQPAPMGSQDSSFNTHPPRATRPSFAPVTAFHSATHQPYRSTKRGRWGALHVSIAWRTYYHKHLKKMQKKNNSLYQELTPEYPATGLPDTEQHKESSPPTSTHPNIDSQRGHSACTAVRSETEKTAESISHFDRRYPSDLSTSSPVSLHSRTSKREKLEQRPKLHWKEKLNEKKKRGSRQAETTKDLPLKDQSWDQTLTLELDGRHSGSLDRERQPESDSSIKVKRVKQDIVDDQFDSSKTLHPDPSPFSTTHTLPSLHTMPVQHIHISDLSIVYPNSSRCNVTSAPQGFISYPGDEMHPYKTASWESMWDAHKRTDLPSRQNTLADYSLNTCKAIRIPHVAQRQKEACQGFFTPPLNFPYALRQQKAIYLRGSEFLHPRQENYHFHHPGYLATSYLGP